MSFYIGIAKLHADIPHETLTFLEDSKNALSPRMFNIFLCFSVFHIHTELISSQYMPGGRISQSQEKGLRPRRKQHVPQLFPPRRPSVPVNTEVHGHREKPPSTSVFTGAVRFKGKLFSRYDSTIRFHACTAHFQKRAWEILWKAFRVPSPQRPVPIPDAGPRVFSGIPWIFREPGQ